MSPPKRILILPGDGIGPEVSSIARELLSLVDQKYSLDLEISEGLIGGIAYEETGDPLPQETLDKAKISEAIFLGAVGGPKWDQLSPDKRPEKGLLGIRSEFDFFANLRPAILSKELVSASTLKEEKVSGLDLLIVRELTGGIYFGEPRGIIEGSEALNTMRYSKTEIERIGRVAFEAAQKRDGKLCSVDKANVLEVGVFWRDVISELSKEYPEVELTHMLVDNAAMQLVREPKQFDVVVTGNLFGDILSDIAAMLTGSIGMLPSASLNGSSKGLYEPVHGSAPDIAGKDMANPLGSILSVAMMMRYTFHEEEVAIAIESSVESVLASGKRTQDIAMETNSVIGTKEMGREVLAKMESLK
ncbi:MAG: 3-isopropylmalate dehydrogenase [SAR86 cluster bacterium]|jgi:3-isopropylmalate dehydrogenase|nr:3-isopropylmalate dehydrogenase [SAR86 cluster bacterium]